MNYDYTFHNMARIGLDNCNKSQTDMQNVSTCNYMTQNYFAKDCTMKTPIQLATMQPGIMYNGGFQVGAGGCNVNDSSDLLIGTIQTHPKSKIDLFHRPFATVPYLGRGAVNPVIEIQIKQGDQVVNKKSVNQLSEKSYIRYHQTPLLASIKARIEDRDDTAKGWVRGGVPSRELTRDKDYINQQNSFQYI